ncbi:outer membrane beta-barrel protein [Persephonella sp.]
MKKVLSLAAAGLLAAGAAQAGTLTVANSDITLYGGVSASYDWQSSDHIAGGTGFNQDNFHVSTFAIGLMKKADANSPIGFNAAFASFAVPTVLASPDVVNGSGGLIDHGFTTTFQPWLAYVTIAPVEGLSVDAGLLWNKFGEAPLTILNRHYNRGILFTGHPVLYAGARVNYDAGIAKVYVGYNQGGGLRQGNHWVVIEGNPYDIGYNVRDAVEAGIVFDLSDFVGFGSKVALHTYNEAKGRDLYVLCTKADLGLVKAGIEIDYTTLDDNLNGANAAVQANGADDSAWGVALNLDFDFLNAQIANVTVPIRIEYVDNGDSANLPGVPGELGSLIYLTGEGSAWSFTITPTYKPTKNTFARVELSYISTDKKIFVDDSGSTKDNRTTVAFEAGFLF